MRLDEVTLYENRSHRILKEGYQDLTEAQKLYQSRIEKDNFRKTRANSLTLTTNIFQA